MTALEEYIKLHFEITHPQQLEAVCALFQYTRIEKGDFFLKEGQQCDKLGFIHSGYLRVYAMPKDTEVTQWISIQGHFGTDFNSFFLHQASIWNVQALSPTELYYISKNDYDQLEQIIPNWKNMERKFLIKCFTILESRIHHHLSMSAEERYLQYFEYNKEIFNQVPLQYIASMLGMTPETFSRIRKKISKINS